MAALATSEVKTSSLDLTVELTSNGHKFTLPFANARLSKYIKDLIETTTDPSTEKVITLAFDHFRPSSLHKFVKFASLTDSEQQDRSTKTKFFEPFYRDIYEIMGLIQVANVLDCKELLSASQEQFLNHYIRKQTPESVLERLGLPKDTKFTAEEEAQVEKEYPWLVCGSPPVEKEKEKEEEKEEE